MIKSQPVSLPTILPAGTTSTPRPQLPATPSTLPQDEVQLQGTPFPAVETPEKPALKTPSGEMAEMVENMRAAEERLQATGDDIRQGVYQDLLASARNNPAGAMAILDDGSAPPVTHSTNIDGFLALMMQGEMEKAKEQQTTAKPKAHPKENHGLLGGHIGIEGTEHVANEVMGIKAHAVEALHAVGSSGTGDAIDAAVTGGKIATHGGHHATPVGEHVQQAAEHTGHAMSGFMAGLTGALAAGSGALGAVMLHVGIKGIKHGIKDKNAEHTLEGVNSTIVGTRSLAAATTMTGHLLHGSEVLTTVAGIAKATLTPLGVVHGAIDTGLGAKAIYEGAKSGDSGKVVKGSLGVGLGLSLIGAAVGGGIPALAAATVFLTGKVIHSYRQNKHHEAQPATSDPNPPAH